MLPRLWPISGPRVPLPALECQDECKADSAAPERQRYIAIDLHQRVDVFMKLRLIRSPGGSVIVLRAIKIYIYAHQNAHIVMTVGFGVATSLISLKPWLSLLCECARQSTRATSARHFR